MTFFGQTGLICTQLLTNNMFSPPSSSLQPSRSSHSPSRAQFSPQPSHCCLRQHQLKERQNIPNNYVNHWQWIRATLYLHVSGVLAQLICNFWFPNGHLQQHGSILEIMLVVGDFGVDWIETRNHIIVNGVWWICNSSLGGKVRNTRKQSMNVDLPFIYTK